MCRHFADVAVVSLSQAEQPLSPWSEFMQTSQAGTTRQQHLQDVVSQYFEALRQRDFSSIPFADDATLRHHLRVDRQRVHESTIPT